MGKTPTEQIRITRGRIDDLRQALRSCPVRNLSSDASARALVDAALEIASVAVWRGPQYLPRVTALPRLYSADEPAGTTERLPDELIFVPSGGLMVLSDVTRAD